MARRSACAAGTRFSACRLFCFATLPAERDSRGSLSWCTRPLDRCVPLASIVQASPRAVADGSMAVMKGFQNKMLCLRLVERAMIANNQQHVLAHQRQQGPQSGSGGRPPPSPCSCRVPSPRTPPCCLRSDTCSAKWPQGHLTNAWQDLANLMRRPLSAHATQPVALPG